MTYVADHTWHHVSERCTINSVRRVDDSKHSLLTVSGNTAVVECRVGIIDDLSEGEALVLYAGSERFIEGLVADLQLRRLRDGMHISMPDELNRVTDRSVRHEGHVAQDTLSRSDDDGVGRS